MSEFIFLYFLGGAIVSNLMMTWTLTNLPVHLYDLKNILNQKKEKLYTREDWETYVSINCGLLGELIVCPICLATHVSWATGLGIYLISSCSPWIILAGALSWPLFSYYFYKKLIS